MPATVGTSLASNGSIDSHAAAAEKKHSQQLANFSKNSRSLETAENRPFKGSDQLETRGAGRWQMKDIGLGPW
jgi:hypothetical protein